MVARGKLEILEVLQSDIRRMEGIQRSSNGEMDLGLGSICSAFPNGSFPLGAVHEFLSGNSEGLSSTIGFAAGLLSSLMRDSGTALWISASRKVFPPALRTFGVQPDRMIFIDLQKERDVIWAVDEALKCAALTAVIGELKEVSFTESRRLQLAVEQSQVTGFILRNNQRKPDTTACVSRWKITSLPTDAIDDLPGIGFPKWRVELLRMRNGKSGIWDLEWVDGRFVHLKASKNILREELPKPSEEIHLPVGLLSAG